MFIFAQFTFTFLPMQPRRPPHPFQVRSVVLRKYPLKTHNWQPRDFAMSVKSLLRVASLLARNSNTPGFFRIEGTISGNQAISEENYPRMVRSRLRSQRHFVGSRTARDDLERLASMWRRLASPAMSASFLARLQRLIWCSASLASSRETNSCRQTNSTGWRLRVHVQPSPC